MDSILREDKSFGASEVLRVAIEVIITELELLNVTRSVVEVGVIASDDTDANCAREPCCNHQFRFIKFPVVNSQVLFIHRMKLVFRALRRSARYLRRTANDAGPRIEPNHVLRRGLRGTV
jgi:hypothetical protein